MITGDRKETASSVAQEIGLLKPDSLVLTSDQVPIYFINIFFFCCCCCCFLTNSIRY